MNLRALSCIAALAAAIAAAQSAAAQDRPKVGALRCEVSSGLGLIVTSAKEMRCIFTSSRGYSERYFGMVRKFGLDLGRTNRGVLAWEVLAPMQGPRRGALAGDYVGVDASATVGVGLGANALIGGSGRSIALQPLSVQAQTGLALAAGVESLTLRAER
jgi:predicted small integral membrane protein